MADPLRNDEPLSSERFPESPSGSPLPGPEPVRPTPVSGTAALLPEDTPARPLGEWPSPEPSRDTRVGKTGGAVGSALGTVVNQAKQIPSRLQDGVEQLKRHFEVITGGGSSELKQRASELADESERKASQLARDARHQARHWEFRARVYAREYPFRFIAASAAAGFAIGFILRLGRSE